MNSALSQRVWPAVEQDIVDDRNVILDALSRSAIGEDHVDVGPLELLEQRHVLAVNVGIDQAFFSDSGR